MTKEKEDNVKASKAESLLDELIEEMGIDTEEEGQKPLTDEDEPQEFNSSEESDDTSASLEDVTQSPTNQEKPMEPASHPSTAQSEIPDFFDVDGKRERFDLDAQIKAKTRKPGKGKWDVDDGDELEYDEVQESLDEARRKRRSAFIIILISGILLAALGALIMVAYYKDPEMFNAILTGQLAEHRKQKAEEERARQLEEQLKRMTKYATLSLKITPGDVKVTVTDNEQPLTGPPGKALEAINAQMAKSVDSPKSEFVLQNLVVSEWNDDEEISHNYVVTIAREGYEPKDFRLARHSWNQAGNDLFLEKGIDLIPLVPPEEEEGADKDKDEKGKNK